MKISRFDLYPHQKKALEELKTGSVLCGGVGSGKSLTALAYFYKKVYKEGMSLYIITTAKKRDTNDWEKESSIFDLTPIVDSWNNIKKYINVSNAFFIFDEQRVVGSGTWVNSFLKITKQNAWILLSATPGDTYMDYIPVFIANGFYKNRSEFIREHVIYKPFYKFPSIDRYVNTKKLDRIKSEILVTMPYSNSVIKNYKNVHVEYDNNLYKNVFKNRWNPFSNEPVKTISELAFVLRRIVNIHPSRIFEVKRYLDYHRKLIVFYNFNYELDLLRELQGWNGIYLAEYNGQKHDPVPNKDAWLYLVQYISGGEGWNCIDTNAILFYSLNYSYRMMTQAAGRIDRINTPFTNLYYYNLISKAPIDLAIRRALSNKKNFNERIFLSPKKHSI